MLFRLLTLLLCSVWTYSDSLDSSYLPKARNVRWESYNFKTLLRWSPKALNFSYTVQFSRAGRDRMMTRHCVRSPETECDFTKELKDLRSCYTADVLTEAPLGFRPNWLEPPSTLSRRFCPYTDTKIGKPKFSLESREKNAVLIRIQDQFTALHSEENPRTLRTLRDVFKHDLKYKILYSKAGSTGKKEEVVEVEEVEMKDLDEDQSYCFSVAVFIPSRKEAKLGNWSLPQCSPAGGGVTEVFSVWVLGGFLLAVSVLVVAAVVLTVFCCRRRRRPTGGAEVLTRV